MNRISVEYLKAGQFEESLDLLKKVVRLLDSERREQPGRVWVFKMQSLTFNNLACYYKKIRMPKAALAYLKQAL